MVWRSVIIPADNRKEALRQFKRILDHNKEVIDSHLVCHRNEGWIGGYFCNAFVHKRRRK